MRTGLIAAGLALFAAVVLFTGGGRARSATVEHVCSAADRQFIMRTELNMAALGLWSEQYRQGEATEAEVVEEAQKAARRVHLLRPQDPSLQKAKVFVAGMLTEYGRAMDAKAGDEDAGPHMFRAYGLANFARDVLVEAEPHLRRAGCDVAGLL